MWERGSFGNPQLILSAIMSFKWDFSFIRLNTTLSHFFVRKATVTPRRDKKETRPETFSGRVRDIYTWETNIFLSSAYNNNAGKWSFQIFLFLYLFIWHGCKLARLFARLLLNTRSSTFSSDYNLQSPETHFKNRFSGWWSFRSIMGFSSCWWPSLTFFFPFQLIIITICRI